MPVSSWTGLSSADLAKHLDERRNVAANNRTAACLRLDGRPPESLIARWKQERDSAVIKRLDHLHIRLDDLNNPAVDLQILRKPDQALAQRLSGENQLQVLFPQLAFANILSTPSRFFRG